MSPENSVPHGDPSSMQPSKWSKIFDEKTLGQPVTYKTQDGVVHEASFGEVLDHPTCPVGGIVEETFEVDGWAGVEEVITGYNMMNRRNPNSQVTIFEETRAMHIPSETESADLTDKKKPQQREIFRPRPSL